MREPTWRRKPAPGAVRQRGACARAVIWWIVSATAPASGATQGEPRLNKQELEEMNGQLQELLRELQTENRQLTLSLKSAGAQIEQLTTQLTQLQERSGKLTRYVYSLSAWIRSRAARSPRGVDRIVAGPAGGKEERSQELGGQVLWRRS